MHAVGAGAKEDPVAEISLGGSVGAPPSGNAAADVRKVQQALLAVDPPLAAQVTVNGVCDAVTVKAIREFQARFMTSPDGCVDPGGRTLMHLSDGFAPEYVGCSSNQRRVIDRALIDAQRWLDNVNRALGSPSTPGLRQKLQNIFHVDPSTQVGEASALRSLYQTLRTSFDWKVPFQCEAGANAYAAWVVGTDAKIHFASNYFTMPQREQVSRLIHERAHTVFNVGHGGMAGGGELDFGVAPDDPNSFTMREALDNAYCYEWLAVSLQPSYRPDDWRY